MKMTEEQIKNAVIILNELIDNHESIRAFARFINEDASDILRWKAGELKIKTRAVVSLCRLYGVLPYDLRPDLFQEDILMTFNN
jgi:uncharacterized membrane protein YkvA (DUF1232 family)